MSVVTEAVAAGNQPNPSEETHMLFRVSGKLTDGNTFATRVDSANAVSAVATARKLLNDNKQDDDTIAVISAAPMKAKPGAIHIGAPRAPRAAKPATAGSKGGKK